MIKIIIIVVIIVITGRLRYKNGNIYDGEIKNFRRSGKGYNYNNDYNYKRIIIRIILCYNSSNYNDIFHI